MSRLMRFVPRSKVILFACLVIKHAFCRLLIFFKKISLKIMTEKKLNADIKQHEK